MESRPGARGASGRVPGRGSVVGTGVRECGGAAERWPLASSEARGRREGEGRAAAWASDSGWRGRGRRTSWNRSLDVVRRGGAEEEPSGRVGGGEPTEERRRAGGRTNEQKGDDEPKNVTLRVFLVVEIDKWQCYTVIRLIAITRPSRYRGN